MDYGVRAVRARFNAEGGAIAEPLPVGAVLEAVVSRGETDGCGPVALDVALHGQATDPPVVEITDQPDSSCTGAIEVELGPIASRGYHCRYPLREHLSLPSQCIAPGAFRGPNGMLVQTV